MAPTSAIEVKEDGGRIEALKEPPVFWSRYKLRWLREHKYKGKIFTAEAPSFFNM